MKQRELRTDEDYDLFISCIADFIYSHSIGHIGYIISEAVNYAQYETQLDIGEDDSHMRDEACRVLRKFLLEEKGILSQKT